MLTVTSLGLDPVAVPAPAADAADAPTGVRPLGMETGSAGAQALSRVWTGEPGTILSSPPGGGKTTTIRAITEALVVQAGLQVVVATPTRAQAMALATKLIDVIPEGSIELSMSDRGDVLDDRFKTARVSSPDGSVKVMTLAAARQNLGPKCDVMIVDESYQATYADVSDAARGATQLLLVGDMGQIGPVVTADVRAFEAWSRSPHAPAPEVFSRRKDFMTFPMTATYRLGAQTVSLIAGMYPFAFESRRTPQRIELQGVTPLPEVGHITVSPAPSVNDPALLLPAAEHAARLVGSVHAEKTPDGSIVRHRVDESDVAVVVAYNTQASFLRAALDERGLTRVEVGTADRLQGGQWAAVVAVDPTAGATNLADHNVSMGRLTVLLSRHTSHLAWVTEDPATWQNRLSSSDLPARDRGVAVNVRMKLSATAEL